MDIKTVGVVGAGQMGNGIAQVAAFSGFQVVMSDIADSFVHRRSIRLYLLCFTQDPRPPAGHRHPSC